MSTKKDTESADQPETAGTAAGKGARDPAEGSGEGSDQDSGKDSGKDSGEGSGKGAAAGKTSGGDRQRRSRGKAAASRSGESRSEKAQAAGRGGSGASKGARAKRDEAADEASGASGSRAGKAQGKDEGKDEGEAEEGAKGKDAGADESAAGKTTTEGTATEGPAGERTATGETAGPARAAAREGGEAAAGERPALEGTPEATLEANKGLDATRADELAYHDATMEELGHEAVDERGHRSVWATLFFILLGAIVVAGATLWAAPKVAPYLPAAVAQQLVPGEVATAERLAALEDRLAQRADETDAALAEMGQRLDALASEVDSAAADDETRAAIAELRETAEGAAEDAQALAGRVDTVQSELAAAREELTAVSDTLTGGGEGTAPPELAAALAALRTRVDKLAETVDGGPPTGQLAERVEALSGRIDELESGMAEAREARSEVSGAIRQARLQSALETLASRLATGQPYAAPLAESAELSETEPPEALAAGADSGLATAAELEASFPRHAQEAIAADIRARSGEGTVGQAVGWLRAQVAGRPVSEQEGDNAAAVTSRIAARLEEGRLAEALAETEALSAPAREGLGGWLAQLRARVDAERALGAWRDQITAGG